MPVRIPVRFALVVMFLLASWNGNADTVAFQSNGSEILEFNHPFSDDPYFSERDLYYLQLLKLALEKSGRPFHINPVAMPSMKETRSTMFLTSGRYNVHWLMTSINHEQKLIPVRFPLFKGLIGWRLLLIHEEQQVRFRRIESVKELQAYTVTQGVDWPDSGILKSNGFNMRPSISWESMVEVVRLRRADFFPRAVTEIWNELPLAKEKSLIIEPHLALHYPSAYYFFLSPGLEHHAQALEDGLYAALVDGSFDQLFNRFFADDIARSRLNERKILHLKNPLLPPRTPLKNERLWYFPEQIHVK